VTTHAISSTLAEKVPGHMRQRDVDDRGIEDLEGRAEHHRERDQPLLRGPRLEVLARPLLPRHSFNLRIVVAPAPRRGKRGKFY